MKKTVRSRFLRVAVLVWGALCLSGDVFADHHATTDGVDPALQSVIDGDHRSPEHRARDQYRHPAETLTWLGLNSRMTVVEITPGRGWYTEILAPYLKDNGIFYAAGYDKESDREYMKNLNKMLDEKLTSNPDVYGTPTITELAPPNRTAIAPEGSADMVLTFRNVHNWMSAGTTDSVFSAMYAALKPGGILGVVEHRGAASQRQDPHARSGYVTEEGTIQIAEKAGFKFVKKSELNANSKDTRDHPKGVWTLPPRLRLGEEDKEKYLSIGESDRMTLKFMKPAE